MLAEEPVDPVSAEPAVRVVQAAFREYLDALTEWGGAVVRLEDLPDEPTLLSFIIAAAMIIDLPERQALLAESDTLRRLALQRALLSRETAMLRTTTSRPARTSGTRRTVRTERGASGGWPAITGRGRPWLNRKPKPATSRCKPRKLRLTSPRKIVRRSGAGSSARL